MLPVHLKYGHLPVGALLVSLIVVATPTPARAHASPNWAGPACSDGAANFEQCSVDPAVDGGSSPCYESHFPGYTPNRIELDMIAVCQAAKGALSASSDDRPDALTRVGGLGDELAADMNQDPQDASDYSDALQRIGSDLQSLGASVITYSGSGSDDDWQDVSDNLNSITLDAQVVGGGQ